MLTRCCNGIVMNEMQKRLENHEENADHEYRDLQKLMVSTLYHRYQPFSELYIVI